MTATVASSVTSMTGLLPWDGRNGYRMHSWDAPGWAAARPPGRLSHGGLQRLHDEGEPLLGEDPDVAATRDQLPVAGPGGPFFAGGVDHPERVEIAAHLARRADRHDRPGRPRPEPRGRALAAHDHEEDEGHVGGGGGDDDGDDSQ